MRRDGEINWIIAGAAAVALLLQAGPIAAYRGPRGGAAAVGPRGGAAAVGPRGGAAYVGPHGGGAAVGPYGGAAARGPYGGAAAVGPHGNVATRPPGAYAYGGHYYYRPRVTSSTIAVFGRPYVGYPGWHAYGTYGLVAPLAAFSSLAFLSAGLLVGSYAAEQERTVYVYVVKEDDIYKEYRVDSTGRVISTRIVPNPPSP